MYTQGHLNGTVSAHDAQTGARCFWHRIAKWYGWQKRNRHGPGNPAAQHGSVNCQMDNSPRALRKSITDLSAELHNLLRDAPWKNTREPGKQDANAQNDSHSHPRKISVVSPPPQGPDDPNRTPHKFFPWWRIPEGIGIIAAVVYAGIAYNQWQDASTNFKVDQRAWIKVSGYLYPSIDTVTVGRAAVSNVGKSVAFEPDAVARLQIKGRFEIVDSKNAPSFNLANPISAVVLPLLFPGDHNDDLQIGQVRPFTPTEIQDFTTGKSYFAVFGYVSYRDQFGKHWTRFCNWSYYPKLGPESTFNALSCESFNAVGDGDFPY